MNERSTATAKTMPARSSTILLVSYKKNRTELPTRAFRSSPTTLPSSQSHSGASALMPTSSNATNASAPPVNLSSERQRCERAAGS